MTGDDIRRIIIEQSHRAHVGHIGSALSIADIVAAVLDTFPSIGAGGYHNRDRLVLSKGHAALALYAGLHLRGMISQAELDTYCQNGTRLGVHPVRDRELGIDFSTGSLGMGLPFAVGSALAAQRNNLPWHVVCILSDAELNEGSTWEAVQLAAQHNLSNLIAIVDCNNQQALGPTREIVMLPEKRNMFSTNCWDALWVDGHDGELRRELGELPQPYWRKHDQRPQVFLARTVFGKGVSFMERQLKWHYLPMDEEEYALARAEVGG